MEENIKKVLTKILQDKEFLATLDDPPLDSSEDEDNEKKTKKRKLSHSPVKLKTVKIKANKVGECSKSLDDSSVRSPAEVSGQTTGPNHGAHESSDEDINDVLTNILANQQDEEDFNEEEYADEDSDLEVMGGHKEGSWSVSDKVMAWFDKVADIELDKEKIEELKKKFDPSEEDAHHFVPPKLPLSLWQSISSGSNHADSYRLKSIFKAQESLYLALCPLLTALDSCEKSLRPSLTSAIQLICSSNLLLNKYRRASVSPYIKKEIRKHMISLPIAHDSLFGKEFEKTTEGVLKEHAVLNKLLHNPTGSVQNRLGFQDQSRGRGKGSFRGRGGRGGFRGNAQRPYRGGKGGRGSRGGGKSDTFLPPASNESH